MTPRLVATDLDGTLVRSDGTISVRTREVLDELDALDVPVVFVTGRPLRWAEEVFDHVGGHGLAIVGNGALVWDVHAQEIRELRAFSPEEVLAVAASLRAAVPGSSFAVETLGGIALETGFLERYAVPPGSARGRLDDLVDGPVLKLLARHERLAPRDYWDRAAAALGATGVVTWSSIDTLLEISAPGVTKASTLALVSAELDIEAADVVAFGDMPNDLPMMAWAGLSYAMANAHPDVLAAAHHVAPSNDDDGVAVVLTRLFGGHRT